MPMAIATCWLSATARMAMPLRDFRKNQPKPARKARLTPAPSNWIGGRKSGPRMNGSSRMGNGRGLVPEKITNGPTPTRMDARPMVAMTTAMTGRPMSLRSMTRSSTKPNTIRPPSASRTASHSGAPHTTSALAATNPAIMTNSPCAKLMASVALYTSTKPSAMSEYISPTSTPLEISSKKKPKSSDMSGGPLDILDVHGGAQRALAAVLVGDGRGQLDAVAPRVEGLDDRRVLLRHVPAPHLAGAGHLGVVGLQVLGQEQEPPGLLGVGQRLVAPTDLVADQGPHLGLLAEIRVRRIGHAPALGPAAHGVGVDGDHRGDRRALVPEGDRLANVRAELQLVLDELRRERGAV